MYYMDEPLCNAMLFIHIYFQVRMLQALGMKSTLITDGNTPINLFSTANGLIGSVVGRRHRDAEDDD